MKKLNYFFSSALLTVILFVSVTVIGQNPFYVNLLQPNIAGIEIVIGDDYLISWDDNLTQPVDVFIDRNDGSGFVLLSNGVGITGSTWIWNTDGETSAHNGCKIRIKSDVSPDTYYTSNERAFNLVNYASNDEIVVEQPSVAGISWAQGSTHTIYWSNTFIGDDVKIEYSYQTGGNWTEIAPSVTGNRFDWLVPNTSGNFKVRVTSNNHAGLTAMSDQPFTITLASGTIQEIYQPNTAGLEWGITTTHLISWRDDLTEVVEIYAYDGTNEMLIAADVTGSTYLWDLSVALPAPGLVAGTDYTIIIKSSEDANEKLETTESFEVVETVGDISVIYQPIVTTSWTKNTRHLISWYDNISGNVNVTWNEGANSGNVALNVSGTTCYWDIPDVAGTYTITVTSIDFSGVSLPSDPFTVTASSGTTIEVLQPSVAGLNWAYNTSHLISWNDNFPENVQIQLISFSDVGGNTDRQLEGDIISSVTSSTHIWDIDAIFPTVLDADRFYKVKIRSIDDISIADSSANTFTINATSGTYVEVLQPNGGEDWMFNSTYLISWIDDLPENVVITLEEYTQAGVWQGKQTIETSVIGSSISWTIDETIDYDMRYKVKVASVLDSANYRDFSDGVFQIWPEGKSPNTNINFNIDLVSVYPNPASGTVSIFTPVAMSQVEIRNMLGQVIYTNNIGTEKTSIDISSYDAGLYIINIIVEGNVVTKKLFIQ